jgi:hypothetical protein
MGNGGKLIRVRGLWKAGKGVVRADVSVLWRSFVGAVRMESILAKIFACSFIEAGFPYCDMYH